MRRLHDFIPTYAPPRGTNSGFNDSAHQFFIESCGAGVAFSGALHFYAPGAPAEYDNLESRNASLKTLYPESTGKWLLFAEEIFGNQFGCCGTEYGMFDLEDGTWSTIAKSFDAFLIAVLGKPNFYTGESLLREWTHTHAPLKMGQQLCPRLPFIAGGEYSLDNVYPLNWEKNIKLRHSVFEQIKNLPDGTKIEVRTGRHK
ncbi:MAG: hypothetical protein KIT44_01215 [Opitutaceae bacterium]|nr:hypothetical protein [Opitutaceae bacterium]